MKHATLLLFVSFGAGWAQTPTSWTPELSMQVKTVGNVVPSPDGRLVAYTQTRAVIQTEKSEMVTQIFLAKADGAHRFQLTRGGKSAGSPSFSPDGRYLYFLSDRSGKRNIYRIAVDGGEAEMLTDWKGAIGSYEVSPDGKWIAFTGRKPSEDQEKAKKEKRDFSGGRSGSKEPHPLDHPHRRGCEGQAGSAKSSRRRVPHHQPRLVAGLAPDRL
jgi:dipeptidyl aminopeptidase/acylaminoacyl peptidase